MWKSIFDRNDIYEYQQVLKHISVSLLKHYKDEPDIGFLSGKSGIATFFLYYAKFSGKSEFYDLGLQLTEEIISVLNEIQVPNDYVSGLSGIGWMINHVFKTNLLSGEIKFVLSELDNFFIDSIDYLIRNSEPYDLFTGINGYLPYILSREDIDISIIEKLFNYYIDSSYLLDNTFRVWNSYFNKKPVINLGFAHGISANIILILKLLQKMDKLQEYKDFVYSIVHFLFNSKYQNYHKIGSLFPTVIGSEELNPKSRLAWCNGDLGVIYSLFQVSELYSDNLLRDRVLKMMDFETKRNKDTETFIFDAILCHGSSGVAHIFNRVYQKTGVESYKYAAKKWYQKSLSFSDVNLDLAGFRTFNAPNKKRVKSLSVLEGISGIGLALISAISDIEPAWDEALLLS